MSSKCSNSLSFWLLKNDFNLFDVDVVAQIHILRSGLARLDGTISKNLPANAGLNAFNQKKKASTFSYLSFFLGPYLFS